SAQVQVVYVFPALQDHRQAGRLRGLEPLRDLGAALLSLPEGDAVLDEDLVCAGRQGHVLERIAAVRLDGGAVFPPLRIDKGDESAGQRLALEQGLPPYRSLVRGRPLVLLLLVVLDLPVGRLLVLAPLVPIDLVLIKGALVPRLNLVLGFPIQDDLVLVE